MAINKVSWKTESVKQPSIFETTDMVNMDNSVCGTDFCKAADILIEIPEWYEMNKTHIQ